MSNAYVDLALTATLGHLDRACEREQEETAAIKRDVLLAREQLLAMQDLLETERRLVAARERADAFARRPLKFVKPTTGESAR